MRPPIFVRALTDAERAQVEAGLRSSDAFVLRRCQIVLASARQERAPAIARHLGCDDQTVRNAIHAFNARGARRACNAARTGPKTSRAAFDAASAEQLRALLHQSPRTFGKPTSLWTLELAAEVSFAEGITAERVSGETIRQALQPAWGALEAGQAVDHQPRPRVRTKKSARDRLIRLAASHPTWVLGFQDEVWWSRLARPALHSLGRGGRADCGWSNRRSRRTTRTRRRWPATACCCALTATDGGWHGADWLRFVDGRPGQRGHHRLPGLVLRASSRPTGKEALLLVWDNAPWHVSQQVRAWIRDHNRQVKRRGRGVRIIACYLPIKSPWLNAIEPKWVHGKRRVVEARPPAHRRRAGRPRLRRLRLPHEPHLAIPEKAA